MKRTNIGAVASFGALGLMTLCSSAHAATWAVLVGVSKYQNPAIKSLKFPSKDATDLRDALVDIGKVPKANILLLTDDQATRENILNAVSQFLTQNVKEGDDVLFSLAGHGVAKGVGLDAKSYFLGTDARGASKEALESSAVSLRYLCTEIGKLPASQFVLLDDACREDPIPGRGLKANNQSDTQVQDTKIVPNAGMKANSATFYACQVGQRAYEDPAKEHGVFTYYILEAITKSAGADANANGQIEMGALASYVRAQVNKWAKAASIDQTPELTTSETGTASRIYVVKFSKASPTAVTLLPPQLVADTEPDTATILVNGTKVDHLPFDMREGKNKVRFEAPGFEPKDLDIQALPGYQYQVAATLAPSGGAVRSNGGEISVQVTEAQRAEARHDWRAAKNAWTGLILQKYPMAYERLAILQQRQGEATSLKDAIDTLVKLNLETKPTPHTYSLLARAYSSYAQKEGAQGAAPGVKAQSNDNIEVGGIKIRNPFGKKKKEEPRAVVDTEKVGSFRVPENGSAAAALARKAADEATRADANDVESYLAQGFSLIGSDSKGANAKDSLAAFRSAVAAAPNAPTASYGLGYGLHYFSMFMKGKDQDRQLEEAVTALDHALALRPNYYEALRVRGACHHLLGHGEQAARDYRVALANQGSATDPDEVASINISQGALLRQRAAGEKGERKNELMKESDGYDKDATDTARDIAKALMIMSRLGFGRGITSFLSNPFQAPYNRGLDLFGGLGGGLGSGLRGALPNPFHF